MLFNRKTSPVFLATVFVVMACLALIGLDGWRTWQMREAILREAAVDASNMAQAMAQHADQTFKEADLVLQVLQEHIAEDGLGEHALERIHRQLMHAVTELPQLHGVFVYDETGRWLVSSQRILPTQYNNADRDYFVYHKQHADTLAHVGRPVQSRSTGDWIFTLSRRIDKPDGSFGGVMLATISFDYFKRYYENFDVGQRGVVLLAHNDGIALIRRTRDSASTGQDLSNAPLLREHISRMERGTVDLASSADGQW